MTRRSAIWTIALSGSLAYTREKAAAFALIGDRYHNSDYIRTGLTRTIVKELGVSVDFTDETSLLDSETLDGYKLLIVLRDGMIFTLADGMTVRTGDRHRTFEQKDIADWMGKRAQAGRLPPQGFPRSNSFS